MSQKPVDLPLQEKPLGERKTDFERIQKKYPDRVPVILLKNSSGIDLGNLPKNKFLVPKDLSLGAFIFVIRKHLKLSETQSLFIFNNRNELVLATKTVAELRQMFPSDDGFLYLSYSGETTMG